jgi:anhydro-N-acetylmuramic acid kinase
MLLDRAARTLFPEGPGFDRDGKLAASGELSAPLLEWLLSHPYFAQSPPKTAGVEQFGITFFERAYTKARALSLSCPREDFIATLTELSARTIVDAIPGDCRLLVTSGGGVHNLTLMSAIERNLKRRESPPRIASADAFGFTTDAKEAIAFAILAYEALRGKNNTLPSGTGARRPVVIGKIVPGRNFVPLMRSIFSQRV